MKLIQTVDRETGATKIFLEIPMDQMVLAHKEMEPRVREAVEAFTASDATVADVLLGLEVICRTIENYKVKES